MDFTLRPVTPDDLPFLWTLREAAMRPNYEAVEGEATARGRPLSLHVQPVTPARRLYERLGFELDAVILDGRRVRMRWTPGSTAVP